MKNISKNTFLVTLNHFILCEIQFHNSDKTFYNRFLQIIKLGNASARKCSDVLFIFLISCKNFGFEYVRSVTESWTLKTHKLESLRHIVAWQLIRGWVIIWYLIYCPLSAQVLAGDGESVRRRKHTPPLYLRRLNTMLGPGCTGCPVTRVQCSGDRFRISK